MEQSQLKSILIPGFNRWVIYLALSLLFLTLTGRDLIARLFAGTLFANPDFHTEFINQLTRLGDFPAVKLFTLSLFWGGVGLGVTGKNVLVFSPFSLC